MVRRLSSTLWAVSAGASVMLALGTAGGAHATAGPTPDRLSKEDLAVTGSVMNRGKPISADIVVTAWPDQQSLAALADGDRVPLLTVAGVRSGVDGSFGVPVDVASLPAAYVSESGQVDLEVTAADATAEMKWNISLRSTRGPTGTHRWASAKTREAAASTGGLTVPTLDFDLESGLVLDSTMPLTSLSGPDGKVLGLEAARAASSTNVSRRSSDVERRLRDGAKALASGVMVPLEQICGTTRKGTIYGVTEYFTRVQGASFASVRVRQGYDSSHTLGVAVAGSSGWKGSGSVTVTLGASGTTPAYSDAVRVANKVNYTKYGSDCNPESVSSVRPAGVHTILSGTGWTARKNFTYACVTYQKGQEFVKQKGTNVTVAGGVELGFVKVNAQSGHNSKTSATWVWTGRGKFCASSSVGTVSAPEVGTMY